MTIFILLYVIWIQQSAIFIVWIFVRLKHEQFVHFSCFWTNKIHLIHISHLFILLLLLLLVRACVCASKQNCHCFNTRRHTYISICGTHKAQHWFKLVGFRATVRWCTYEYGKLLSSICRYVHSLLRQLSATYTKTMNVYYLVVCIKSQRKELIHLIHFARRPRTWMNTILQKFYFINS